MRHVARGLLDVARPLEHHLLVRARAGPDRQRELHGLEVEVVPRVRQRLEERRGRGVEHAQPGVGRERACALGVALLVRRAAHLALLALAERDEGTLERAPALRPGAPDRERPREELVEAAHPAGDVRHDRPRLVGDGDLAQQAAVVAPAGIDEARVDDGHAEPVERHARALSHPALDGDVLQVVLLEPRRRLDLDHAAAAGAPLEDVGADQHALVAEGGLVESHVTRALQRLFGLPESLAEVDALPDQEAARVQLARHLADAVAGGEAPPGVGAVLLELGAMHGKPQAFAALQPGVHT